MLPGLDPHYALYFPSETGVWLANILKQKEDTYKQAPSDWNKSWSIIQESVIDFLKNTFE